MKSQSHEHALEQSLCLIVNMPYTLITNMPMNTTSRQAGPKYSHATLYSIILYHAILCYIILYYIMLYYIISYCIVSYYVMLYYIILCYITSYCSVLGVGRARGYEQARVCLMIIPIEKQTEEIRSTILV